MTESSLSRSRQLILAAACGYDWPQIEPYVTSLRKFNSTADVVFLVHEMDNELRQHLQQAQITALPINSIIRKLPDSIAQKRFSRHRLKPLYRLIPTLASLLPGHLSTRCAAWGGTMFHHVACSRYLYYYLYLTRDPGRYDSVILTDVRDVIFQADPFQLTPENELWVFYEHSVKHGEHWGNDTWVEMGYGKAGLGELRGKRISCSGITMGSTQAMLDYLQQMTWELVTKLPGYAGYDGVDQGVHNWLLGTGRLPQAKALENYQAPVLTMHESPDDLITWDDQERIMNQDGSVIPILHQYDRHPEVSARLLAQLNSPHATLS